MAKSVSSPLNLQFGLYIKKNKNYETIILLYYCRDYIVMILLWISFEIHLRFRHYYNMILESI